MLASLLVGILTLAFDIQPSRANGTIYIWADGSIEGTTSIVTSDNIRYVFTSDVIGYIVVFRSNIIIDGQGHTATSWGGDMSVINLDNVNSVTIEATNIFNANRSGWGIALSLSTNCSIHENNITNNRWGIYFYCSSNNNIYHNNFIGNTEQVHSINSTNTWDDGYPSGGNYWSDYAGVDVKSGPNQDLSGSDGIGDTPYVIDASHQDRYPLMNPWPSLFDLNRDGKTDIKDLALAAQAFGTYPQHPRWNPLADINKDGIMDIRDLVLIAKNFGKTYP